MLTEKEKEALYRKHNIPTGKLRKPKQLHLFEQNNTEGKPLTQRELQVMLGVAHGLTNATIAKRLYLSEETVKSHMKHILAKLNARSRAHAVYIMVCRGLLPIRRDI